MDHWINEAGLRWAPRDVSGKHCACMALYQVLGIFAMTVGESVSLSLACSWYESVLFVILYLVLFILFGGVCFVLSLGGILFYEEEMKGGGVDLEEGSYSQDVLHEGRIYFE